jgi:hypothetical protein
MLTWQSPSIIRSPARPPARAAQQRAQSHHQLLQIEGLGQVVIGARLKTGHLVLDGAACGEDEHRHIPPLRAPVAQQVDAVAIGQAQVQHAGIKVTAGHVGSGLGHAGRRVAGEAMQFQPGLDAAGHQGVVFDDQNVHGVRLWGSACIVGRRPWWPASLTRAAL